jgi:sulfoxide reductase catalytic subunit YedY
MLIGKPDGFKSSEVTDKGLYLNRRNLLRGAVLAASTAATAGLYRALSPPPAAARHGEKLDAALTLVKNDNPAGVAAGFHTDEPPTGFEDITNYNNFYEFSTGKRSVAAVARDFVSRPWTVEVGGLAAKPRTFDIDDLERLAPLEERVYRMRCVEGWSMVIPWLGLPLAKVLDAVEPLSHAKFVAFETLFDPERMPNQSEPVLEWPYVEGLRVDEAMHPLTILSVGLYGERLLPQNGAPVRLVVP